MNDHKTSMSAMADKFADKEDVASSRDESSSFEEVPKPVERPSAVLATKQEEKTGVRTPPQAQPQQSPTKTTSAPAPEPKTDPKSAGISTPPAETSKPTNVEPATPGPSGAKGAAEGIKGALQEIRGLLVQQGQDMAAQAERIERLTKEIAGLKIRLGE